MATLKSVLNEIRKELTSKEKVRENALGDMRKATSLSKQSILLIHQKRLREAKKLIEQAKTILAKLNESATKYPEIVYTNMFSSARQEYAEANIFLNSVERQVFITPEDINVPSMDYILGLADVIGEYRRLALDALREGDVKRGEECLATMDEIYVELMAMDEAYSLVGGLRRKSDVARKIIEITRGDITQEIRRDTLEKYLRRFEKLAPKKRRS